MADRPTLFLLPGLLCDESAWAPQVAALADVADVRVPGFLGFSSIPDMARSVLEGAPGRFSVAGHSMGARVALEVVRMAPERVERLALLDTGTHGTRPGEPEKRQELVDLAERDGMAALAASWLPPMVHPDRLGDAGFMAGLYAMVGRATPAQFAGQVRALLDRPDAEAALRTVRCPVLVGVGRQDAWSPPAQHEAMLPLVPQARYVVWENSGHMAPLEAADGVTAALREWLAVPAVRVAA